MDGGNPMNAMEIVMAGVLVFLVVVGCLADAGRRADARRMFKIVFGRGDEPGRSDTLAPGATSKTRSSTTTVTRTKTKTVTKASSARPKKARRRSATRN